MDWFSYMKPIHTLIVYIVKPIHTLIVYIVKVNSKIIQNLIILGSCDWILMILDSLEPSHRDQHFGNKIIQK